MEHLDTAAAAEVAEGETPKEEIKEEQTPEEEAPKEEVEEEVNNLTYAEYIKQKNAENAALKRGEARKPDEIKVSNIQKYSKNDTSVKGIKSNIKKHEAYAMSGISGDVEVGFQPIGEEPVESFDTRGRGRGRGGRGGRGGYRGAPRDNHQTQQPRRGGRKKFVAQDDEFPPL